MPDDITNARRDGNRFYVTLDWNDEWEIKDTECNDTQEIIERQSRPSHDAIAVYCVNNYPELCLDLGEPCCMACAKFREDSSRKDWNRYERAHIVASMIGGSYNPSNFLLLCKECHATMPNVPDKTYVLQWAANCPCYWSSKMGLVWDNLLVDYSLDELANVLIKDVCQTLKQCGTHATVLTPMTIAWAYRVWLNKRTIA